MLKARFRMLKTFERAISSAESAFPNNYSKRVSSEWMRDALAQAPEDALDRAAVFVASKSTQELDRAAIFAAVSAGSRSTTPTRSKTPPKAIEGQAPPKAIEAPAAESPATPPAEPPAESPAEPPAEEAAGGKKKLFRPKKKSKKAEKKVAHTVRFPIT